MELVWSDGRLVLLNVWMVKIMKRTNYCIDPGNCGYPNVAIDHISELEEVIEDLLLIASPSSGEELGDAHVDRIVKRARYLLDKVWYE